MVSDSRRKLTIKEVAVELSCSEQTVAKYIKRGDLKSIKIGRLRRITREALDEFLASQSVVTD